MGLWSPDVYPYYECSKERFDAMCAGMTAAGKGSLANLLAHHCLPLRRDRSGWILTRMDLAMEGKFWHVSNEGKQSYDYKPDSSLFLSNAPVATHHHQEPNDGDDD